MSEVLEWCNHNSYRAYPFAENANRVAADQFELTNDTIVDAALISYGTPANALLLDRLVISGSTQTYRFTYGSLSLELAIVVPLADPVASVYVNGTSGAMDALLRIQFGTGVNAYVADGTHIFNGLAMEPSIVQVQSNSRVSGIGIQSASLLTGDILVRAGYNASVSFSKDRNAIRIGAAIGAGSGVPCEQLLNTDAECNSVQYYINGVPPDAYGSFTLLGGPGISVTSVPGSNTIQMRTTVKKRPSCPDDQ